MRLAAADREVRAGCLECLEQAFDQYTALQTDPAVGGLARDAAALTALLIAVRENELGLLDSGRIQQARDLVASPSASLSLLMEVADALASKPRGASRSPSTDEENRASVAISRNQARWVPALRQLTPDDLIADYLWLGLACGPYGFDVADRTDRRRDSWRQFQCAAHPFQKRLGLRDTASGIGRTRRSRAALRGNTVFPRCERSRHSADVGR